MAMATPVFSPLPLSHVKQEHAPAMFSMESGGGLGLLDLLASVATQTLATDQSIQHIVTRPMEASDEDALTPPFVKRKRASQQQQRRLMDHDAFDKEQLLRMAPASLLKLFAEQDFDEIRRVFRYRCFFNPEACSYENQSFGNEAKAKLGMKRHLLGHVQKVDNVFMAEPIAARRRRLERAQSREDASGPAYETNEYNDTLELSKSMTERATGALAESHNSQKEFFEPVAQEQVGSNGSGEDLADDNLECREQLDECDDEEVSCYDKPFLDLKREVLERRQAFSTSKLFKENLNPVEEWLLRARKVIDHDHGPVKAQDNLDEEELINDKHNDDIREKEELKMWRRAVEEARRLDQREDFSVLNISMMDVGYDLELGAPWPEDEDAIDLACDDSCEAEFSEAVGALKSVEVEEDEEAYERRLALEAIKELQARGATTEASDGSFWCSLCVPRKQFTAYTTLLSHLRGHAGFRPYECRLCNAVFTRQHSLNYHMLIHSNATRFTCNDCGRKFRHPSHFKEHRRRHTGESPYLCGECSIRFKTRNTFKRHLKVFHGKLLTSSGSLVVLPPAEFAKVQEEERRREETRERKHKRKGEGIPEKDSAGPKSMEPAGKKRRRRSDAQSDLPARMTDDESNASSMHETSTPEGPLSPRAAPSAAPFSQAFLASINGQQVLLIPKSEANQTSMASPQGLPPLIPSEAVSAPASVTSPAASSDACGQSKLEQCLRYGSAAVNTSTKAPSGASVGQTFFLANPINIPHQNSVAQINSIRLVPVPVPEMDVPVKTEQDVAEANDVPQDLTKRKVLRVYEPRRREQLNNDFLPISSQS